MIKNHRNTGKIRLWALVPISFFCIMIVVSLVIGLAAWNNGASLMKSCLVGAGAGFFITWLPTIIITRIFLYFIRGMPCRKGHFVKITTGQRKGSTGEVIDCDNQRGSVHVRIQASHNGTNEDLWLDWFEVKRIKSQH